MKHQIESELTRLQSLIENLDEVIYEYDQNGVITYVSPSVEKISQLRQSDFIGHYYDELIIDENYSREERLRRLDELKTLRHERKFRLNDGSIRWTLTSTKAVYENGIFRGGIGVLIDVTQRKLMELEIEASEFKYRRIFESVQDIFYEATMDGIIVDISPSIYTISKGRLNRNDLIGKSFGELFESFSTVKERESLRQTLNSKGSITDYLLTFRDGQEIYYLSLSTSIIFDSNQIPNRIIGTIRDITKQKLAEEKTLKSEALYHSILDESPDDITVSSLDGTIEIVSLSGVKLFGYGDASEIIGRSMFEFVSSGKDQKAVENLEKIIRKELKESLDLTGIRKDGTTFPIGVSAGYIPDKYGNPDKIISIVRDMSAKKKAEEALIESENSLNYAQEIAGQASWEFFIETRELKASRNFYNLYNINPETTGKELFSFIMKMISPENPIVFNRDLLKSFKRHKNELYEIKCILPGDHIKWFKVYVSPIFLDNKLFSIKGVNIDITSQKLKDDEIRKLSLAVSQSPVAVIITNLEADIEFVNPEFERMTGYKKSFIYGKNASILKSGKTPRGIYDRLWVNLSNGRQFETEWLNKKAGGELYWEHIIITPIIDDHGRVTNYLAVKTDITERKKHDAEMLNMNDILDKKVKVRTAELLKANEEIRAAREIAVKANKAKSDFLSRMSHELRTPLNAILGYSQLLEISKLGDSQMKGVKSILQSGNHLLDLINEVLDISRIENGKLEVSTESVNVNTVLHEVLNVVLPMTKTNNISLNFDNILLKNDILLTDRQRFKQIMINIIANAIKYNNPQGSVTGKSYEVDNQEDGKSYVRFEISDTGIGISKENMERLYHPFERIGAELTGIEGTGLGLTVVQKLIEIMDGKIGVESEPGKGSTFWFELPKDISQENNVQKNDDKKNNMQEINNQTGKILYIEDNLSNIELIEQILELQMPNVTLTAVSDGKKAVETALGLNPDIIFLDLNLPGMHGSEVLKLLKTNPLTLHIPVIIISADAMYDKTKELFDIGAHKFLTKPFRLNEFLDILNEFF